MRTYFTTTAIAIALTATSAAAAGSNTDISQVVSDAQKALNLIGVAGGSQNIIQSATNAANLATLENITLDDVSQRAFVDQTALNAAVATRGYLLDLEQNATNVANSINLTGSNGDTSTVVQKALSGSQVAGNLAKGTWLEDLDQTAVNARNLVDVDDVNAAIYQVSVGDQVAVNTTLFSDDTANLTGTKALESAAQAATNVVNSITADDLGGTSFQAAHVDQLAANAALNFSTDADYRIGDVNGLTQSATNAANMINVSSIGTSATQVLTGDQYAGNVLSGRFLGKVDGLDQSATNAGNIMNVGSLPSRIGTLEVAQFSNTTQLASNLVAGNSGISGATQAATNVANSIGMITQ